MFVNSILFCLHDFAILVKRQDQTLVYHINWCQSIRAAPSPDLDLSLCDFFSGLIYKNKFSNLRDYFISN